MILFVNGCVREGSRTLELAGAVLSQQEDEIQEVRLFPDGPEGLDREKLYLREALLARKEYDHPMFRWAKQFAQADTIVIAAPYWDLLFPARVRAYLEEVSVSGITFRYGEDGNPHGLCRAKRLIYVTAAGGMIFRNFGYEYVETLAKIFFGISDVQLVKAEELDIRGMDPEAIIGKVKGKITGER